MPADKSAELLATIIGMERAEASPQPSRGSAACGFLLSAIRIAGARLITAERGGSPLLFCGKRLRDVDRRP